MVSAAFPELDAAARDALVPEFLQRYEARIGQHAPALWQRQQCNEADTDDADETVVAEGADHQAQRQLHRR
ncbi:hypothetical protein G6F54_014077 [Rhizopus delemar]|nr:hypothetical protein G6F54_014077 [Rhizopus delemar]